MKTAKFVDRNPTLDTYWRSIVLLGRNVASYKFALAESLLEIPTENTFVKLEDLAVPYSKNICEHLKYNDKQAIGSANRFLNSCRQFNRQKIDEDELRKQTIKLGFRYVIDAFHNVANAEVPRFYEDARSNQGGIVLTDNFYELIQNEQADNFKFEVTSRWRLWETAISLNINPKLIEVDSDPHTETLFVVNEKARRIDVTSSRYTLSGYQKGKCFYCAKEIRIEQGVENSCDMDHFFPDVLKHMGFTKIDQVWNLVLACRECNRGNNGKFERIPDIKFVEALNKRNNFYVESHHPLRETIINQTGKSNSDRHQFLQTFFNEAVDAIPSKKKWNPPEILGVGF